VLTAVLFGLAASSALVIGGVAGAYWNPPRLLVGILLAFASGALISALAFELFEEAFKLGGATRAGLGLLAGAAVFVIADTLLERRSKKDGAGSAVGFALLAGVTLDGVPENLALGTSLVEGASISLLVAIFFSNLPESLVGAAAMREAGQSSREVVTLWVVCAIVLAAAVVLGRGVAQGLPEHGLSFALSFAGGAVLASLADTLMPEAFEKGNPSVAFATCAGFFLSFVLAA
jgi:ZIP family zinc transporter